MPTGKLENNLSTNSAAAALAACEDLMLCVLSRLPVISICRFRSVCKSWNHLLSTQEFMKLQFKLSSESKNQSFLIHRINENNSYTISVFNIESNEKIFDHPFNHNWIDIVGCCRGLICIRRGQGFVLWNPAMSLSKTVSPLKDHHGDDFNVSLGFGYDAEGDDFKVVRILLKDKSGLNHRIWRMCVSCVEVYSVNSDSWTTIDPGFRFSEVRNRSDVTVNGNPYWVVRVDKNDVLICFDMSKLIFKIVPLSTLDYEKVKPVDVDFVDLNGSLGAFVFTWCNGLVNVWVFDNVEQVWIKSHSVKMNRNLRCLKYYRVLGWPMRPKGQLIVFNSETKFVKNLFNLVHDFEIYDYTPSLAYIQGMEKVTLRKCRLSQCVSRCFHHWCLESSTSGFVDSINRRH
ncbi:hypothetical protein CASFOL_035233 [Castilleja foliolosa]|uniref:F-box domain-containing protein n=1 Tax=Castilleja foliolosa TaxID=1961234 RepID=A0ABD3BTM3_9LAMI